MFCTSLTRRNRDWDWPTRSLVRYPLLSLDREMRDVFRDFFGDSGLAWTRGAGAFVPPVDVGETEQEITVRAELPGLDPEQVTVSLEDDALTIRGEKKHESEDGADGRARTVERTFGSFERKLRVPDNIDADGIKAVHKNGVLTVTLPKLAGEEPRTIEIQSE